MSTAGKVLVVLSVLMMAVWVVLISAVAQLNMTATENIKNLKADIAKLKVDVAQTQHDAEDRRSQVIAEQVAKERTLFGQRARLSDAGTTALHGPREPLASPVPTGQLPQDTASAREDQTLRNQEKATSKRRRLTKRRWSNGSRARTPSCSTRSSPSVPASRRPSRRTTAEVNRVLKGNPKPAARPASFIR